MKINDVRTNMCLFFLEFVFVLFQIHLKKKAFCCIRNQDLTFFESVLDFNA